MKMISFLGSGKSSLLRTIYRVLKPDTGLITLDNENVWQLSVRDAARRTAVVTQEHPAEFDFTVKEFVGLGRNPHKALLDRDTAEDARIIQAAIERVRLQGFEQLSFQTLSGGEKQRALVARALTQQTKFLVMDEPTNHLDIRYQLEILELVKTLGVTTIAALHDLKTVVTILAPILLLAIGGIGIWLLVEFAFPNLQGFWGLKITSVVVIAATVIIAVYLIIRQGISTKPSLIIDQHGLTDNSTLASVGLIPWRDITSIEESTNVFKQKLIVVIVRNPDEYINKAGRMREGLQAQYKQFGSPIVIFVHHLDYDAEELTAILNRRL